MTEKMGPAIMFPRGEIKSDLLATAPIELGEGWGNAAEDARAVIERVRQVCLAGIRLVSDRQPAKIRVDEHTSGPPHIWLHKENPDTAWIVVDFAQTHWIQLAYQLGHELGHVLCNSWVYGAQLDPPSHWLEEAMVEAFSLCGLARLADSWEKQPPFRHNEGFAADIRNYRDNAIARYRTSGDAACPVQDIADWYRCARAGLDRAGGLAPNEGPGILSILAEFERDPECAADLGALNRWPERTGLPTERYLATWRDSCTQIGAPGVLPGYVKTMFGLNG
jgi:hypothetical protein